MTNKKNKKKSVSHKTLTKPKYGLADSNKVSISIKYGTLFLFLLMLQVTTFLVYKYYKEKPRIAVGDDTILVDELPAPKFENPELEKAYEGKVYSSDVIATVYYEANIKLEFSGVPEGLDVVNCNPQQNLDILRKPNSINGCQIKGIAPKKGQYEIIVTATISELGKSATKNYTLTVE